MHHKITATDVRTMRGLRAFGCTVQWIADQFAVSLGQTSRVLRGLRWGHVS